MLGNSSAETLFANARPMPMGTGPCDSVVSSTPQCNVSDVMKVATLWKPRSTGYGISVVMADTLGVSYGLD
eukprot:7934312-Lingulodinium_polyedra.AAC.1